MKVFSSSPLAGVGSGIVFTQYLIFSQKSYLLDAVSDVNECIPRDILLRGLGLLPYEASCAHAREGHRRILEKVGVEFLSCITVCADIVFASLWKACDLSASWAANIYRAGVLLDEFPRLIFQGAKSVSKAHLNLRCFEKGRTASWPSSSHRTRDSLGPVRVLPGPR